MPNFFKRFSIDGRYRFRRGRSIDPREELHPEMADQQVNVSPETPSTPEELIARQEQHFSENELSDKKESPAMVSEKVKEVIRLIEKSNTSALEDQQIALSLVIQLEEYHDETVKRMQSNDESDHSQIAAWAIDADRLYRSRMLLESIDLN